jgi:hypothetical protein
MCSKLKMFLINITAFNIYIPEVSETTLPLAD